MNIFKMNRLLSVEIIKDKCQCCYKSFEPQNNCRKSSNMEFQKIFKKLFGEKLNQGFICLSCFNSLSSFHQFYVDVTASRSAFHERSNQEIKEVNYTLTTHQILPKTSEIAQETKIQKLLRKFNVQFVESDDGKPTGKPKKIICPICSKTLSLNSLQVHLQTHEGNREYKFMCEICSKKCFSNSELIVHIRKHTKEKPFQCDMCQKKFFNCKKNLIQHFRTIHLNQKRRNKTLERCQICLKQFSHDYLVHFHMKKAHPMGVEEDGLQVNPITDHYHCETCGGQYKTRRYFDNHVCLVNAGSSTNCAICSLPCKNRFETIKHIQSTHAERLDEARWKCLVCNTTVVDKLVLHVESVHATTGFKCSLCSKTLKNRRCLRNHIFVMHENGGEIRKQKRKSKKIVKV